MLPHKTRPLPAPDVARLLELLQVDEVAYHFVCREVVQQAQYPLEKLAILPAKPDEQRFKGRRIGHGPALLERLAP